MKIISSLSVALLALIVCTGLAEAKVKGKCANCHIMHNSQDGNPISPSPVNNLLTDSCVGCHSSTTGDTITTVGLTKIPIVWNIGASYPSQPLAAGNFNSIGQGSVNDSHGHNVWGISDADLILTEAPGRTNCSGGCHFSLALSPADAYGNKTGCQGCHTVVNHHTDTPAYRFLQGHESGNNYVMGIESPDWEQVPSTTNHNVYTGVINPPDNNLATTHSMSSFCGGCHTTFHETDNLGNPWLRHPTDIALPEGTTEYNNYDPVTGYNPLVPVGWVDTANPVRSEAVVMCLSCHRAHGTQYPDILRWDYLNNCDAGTANNNCGCFVCHSTKDDL